MSLVLHPSLQTAALFFDPALNSLTSTLISAFPLHQSRSLHLNLVTIVAFASTTNIKMPRETQRISSSPSMLMRGTLKPSTAIPPSLNRQNSHTSRHGYSRALSGDATSLLSRVVSSSRNPTPRNSPPASPSQSPREDSEIHWEVVRRRLSDECQGMLCDNQMACHTLLISRQPVMLAFQTLITFSLPMHRQKRSLRLARVDNECPRPGGSTGLSSLRTIQGQSCRRPTIKLVCLEDVSTSAFANVPSLHLHFT